MDNQNIPQENQDLKLVSQEQLEQHVLPPIQMEDSEQQFEKELDNLTMKNSVLKQNPAGADFDKAQKELAKERPVFIACLEPELINRLNDFLRGYGPDDVTYKVFVVSKDITDKLYETYWFSKLGEEEQKIVTEQKQNAEWQEGARNLADNVFMALQAVGFGDDSGYVFKIHELKDAFKHYKKTRLNSKALKQIIDTLLVFGYIIKFNEETAFNKMQFKLLATTELKLQHVRQQHANCIKKSALLNDEIEELEHAAEFLVKQLEQNKAITDDGAPTDPSPIK